jgi:putative hydroxymethylpyrimidine transport system substrate-binding protein
MKNSFRALPLILAAITLTVAGVCMPHSACAQEKITVLLDWFVNPDHGPLLVAREKGFFRERGLEVDFQVPSNPNDPPKLVAAGKADLAVSYQPQHHFQVDQGLPLVRIATLVATPLNCLVVLADGGIKKISDLKGKTVGYSVSGFETLVLRTMLEQSGLTLKDIELVNVNFSLSPSLLSGKTDAVIGAFRNFELNQMDIAGRAGRAFYVEEHGVPPYDELIVVANRERVGDPRLKRFVEAMEAGVQFLINHPEDAWNLFIRGRKDLADELNRRAWRDTASRFALRPGALDRNRYARFARFLQEKGEIKKIPPLETYAMELP